MRQLSLGLWFLVACSGGSGGGGSDTPVPELSSASQQALCERFLDDICAKPDFASFCEDPCHPTACAAAVENGHVAMQCMMAPNDGSITEAMVEECAETGSFAVCAEGGGCMFDALEAACP